MIALGDWTILVMKDAKSETPGGLILPDIAQERACVGSVLSVGPETKLGLKQGDIVLVHKYGGVLFEVEDRKFLHCQEKDIICKVNGEAK